jgi:hypothetical protein
MTSREGSITEYSEHDKKDDVKVLHSRGYAQELALPGTADQRPDRKAPGRNRGCGEGGRRDHLTA